MEFYQYYTVYQINRFLFYTSLKFKNAIELNRRMHYTHNKETKRHVVGFQILNRFYRSILLSFKMHTHYKENQKSTALIATTTTVRINKRPKIDDKSIHPEHRNSKRR